MTTDPMPASDGVRAAGRVRRRWLTGVALAGAFFAGGLILPMAAASAQDGAMHAMMDHGHGDVHAKAMAHVSHMLDAVGASADQKARITAILHEGFAPMGQVDGHMRDVHTSLITLLTAPTIDSAGLERLRAGEIADLDQASRTMVQALEDAAAVLTPDQRAKLAAMIAGRHP